MDGPLLSIASVASVASVASPSPHPAKRRRFRWHEVRGPGPVEHSCASGVPGPLTRGVEPGECATALAVARTPPARGGVQVGFCRPSRPAWHRFAGHNASGPFWVFPQSRSWGGSRRPESVPEAKRRPMEGETSVHYPFVQWNPRTWRCWRLSTLCSKKGA